MGGLAGSVGQIRAFSYRYIHEDFRGVSAPDLLKEIQGRLVHYRILIQRASRAEIGF